jgi:hypothetical protein
VLFDPPPLASALLESFLLAPDLFEALLAVLEALHKLLSLAAEELVDQPLGFIFVCLACCFQRGFKGGGLVVAEPCERRADERQ